MSDILRQPVPLAMPRGSRPINGANTAPPDQVEQAETLASVLCQIRDHLSYQNMPKPARRLVDVYDSESSATSITLRRAVSALVLVSRIIYSVPAAALLTIGQRQIPLVAGTNSLATSELALHFNDNVTLALTGGSPTAGAMYLELIGWQVSPAEHLEVIS